LNLLLDSSVWIEHLRNGGVERLLPTIRGRFLLWCDSVVMAEITAGCRSKRERRTVTRLFAPFVRAGRIVSPNQQDFDRAGLALSRLREQGRTLSNPGGALLDGLIACCAIRVGALLVTANWRDFESLRTELPLRIESLSSFQDGMST
jgi:predicted nucleic acid-binding protein